MTDRYEAAIYPAAVGWVAAVTWQANEDVIGLQGPTFWRPTRAWVERRANRHIRRRLGAHRRLASAQETMSEAQPETILVRCEWCHKTHAAQPGEEPCGGPGTWWEDATGLRWEDAERIRAERADV